MKQSVNQPPEELTGIWVEGVSDKTRWRLQRWIIRWAVPFLWSSPAPLFLLQRFTFEVARPSPEVVKRDCPSKRRYVEALQLHCMLLHRVALSCLALYEITLCCIALYFMVLHQIAWQYVVWHYLDDRQLTTQLVLLKSSRFFEVAT